MDLIIDKSKENPIDFETYKNSLIALKNVHNMNLFGSYEQPYIKKLWDMKADLNQLLQTFKTVDNNGYNTFSPLSVYNCLKDNNYNVSDFLQISKLTDHNNNKILDARSDLYKLIETRIKIQDIKEIARIKDSEGKTIYRLETQEIYGFGGFDSIVELLSIGGTEKIVTGLANILDVNNVSIFRTPMGINQFVEVGGTVDYANDLNQITDNNNNQIFDEYSIYFFKKIDGTIDYAKKLTSLKDTYGSTIFSEGEDVYEFCELDAYFDANDKKHKYYHRDIRIAEEFVNLRDSTGQTVFRDGKDINVFLKENGDIKQAKEYISILNKEGKTYFRGDEISLLKENNIPIDYIKSLTEHELNAQTIVYYYNLKLTNQDIDFKNSDKPKALLLYPTSNPPDFLGFKAFSDDDSYQFLSKIYNRYNTKFRAISTVEEMYRELDDAPELNLLILGGHGSQETLTFGKSNEKYGVVIDKKSGGLSTQDNEFGEHTKRLSPDGVVFLDSCLNGQGGGREMNLANFVAQNIPGRKVISSTEPFNAGKITIKNIYPLDLSIVACYIHTDSTYCVKSNK